MKIYKHSQDIWNVTLLHEATHAVVCQHNGGTVEEVVLNAPWEGENHTRIDPDSLDNFGIAITKIAPYYTHLRLGHSEKQSAGWCFNDLAILADATQEMKDYFHEVARAQVGMLWPQIEELAAAWDALPVVER